MISPFPPGGSVDITARFIAEPLGSQLGTRIVIENRSGASGNIGMETAARAAPDGYTIVLNTIPLVTNQSLFEKLTWDPINDFAPIGMVATSPHVLVVPAKVPVNSVDDLLRLARANPGKLSYASAGVGTTFHLCGEMFKDATQHLHPARPLSRRRTGAPRTPSRPGRHELPDAVGRAAARQGRHPARAGGDRARRARRCCPTSRRCSEAGVERLPVHPVAGAARARRHAAAVVTRLNGALKDALNSAEVQDKFQAQGFDAFTTTPRRGRQVPRRRGERYARLIKSRGITAN